MVQATPYTSFLQIDDQVDNCYYHIDEQQFQDERTLVFMIWQRLCWEGDCQFCKNREGPKPVKPPGFGLKRSIMRTVRQCSKESSFLLPNMSVTEAVFRILLKNGNNPMQFSDILAELEDAWMQVMALKSITSESVQQMLDSDNEYRICRTEPAAE